MNNDNDDRRMLFENCRLKSKRTVNPIIDWSDTDVWQFLRDQKAPVNNLYGEGWCRVGCIGCPMAGTKGREEEFNRFPEYKKLYLLAFGKMIEARKQKGLSVDWQSSEDVFNWWMEYDVLPGQVDLFGDMEEDD